MDSKTFYLLILSQYSHVFTLNVSLFGAPKLLINKMSLTCLSLLKIQNHRSIFFIFRSHWVFLDEGKTRAQAWGCTGTLPVEGKQIVQ